MAENNIVRVSCQSTDWKKFCLVSKDSDRNGIGGRLGEALDRCKGVGCEGRECPTQFIVTREVANRLKKENPSLVIME